jgi:hypothetical protein
MKTKPSLHCIVTVVGLALASALNANEVPQSNADSPGLLGKTYSGLEFGYTHHVEGAPDVLHRYGFVSSRPLAEAKENVDAAFRYNYTRGSAFGLHADQHDIAMGFTGYLPTPDAKPFIEGELGWAWTKVGGVKDNSLVYTLGAGVELRLNPRLSLAPFVQFQDAPQFHDRLWNFGARATHHFERGWSGTLTIQSDDAHNIEYALGVLRRF